MEDPNLHLSVFLKACDMLKMKGTSIDAIQWCLFPFSLKEKARAWLHSLLLASITTWGEPTRVFLAKFFPPRNMASLKNQITSFAQQEYESLCEEWEQFKDPLRLCPHHGLQKWMVVHTFYKRIRHVMRSMIDAVAGGTLMSKPEDEAYNLIEEMALSHC